MSFSVFTLASVSSPLLTLSPSPWMLCHVVGYFRILPFSTAIAHCFFFLRISHSNFVCCLRFACLCSSDEQWMDVEMQLGAALLWPTSQPAKCRREQSLKRQDYIFRAGRRIHTTAMHCINRLFKYKFNILGWKLCICEMMVFHSYSCCFGTFSPVTTAQCWVCVGHRWQLWAIHDFFSPFELVFVVVL